MYNSFVDSRTILKFVPYKMSRQAGGLGRREFIRVAVNSLIYPKVLVLLYITVLNFLYN